MRKAWIAAAAALALSGCTADYATNDNSPVALYVADVNGGRPVQSSVRFPVSPDTVLVSVANRSKNPNFTNVPQVAMAIILERYEVRYFRSDGRATEGVDVPYRISGNLTTAVDVATSGTVSFPVEVVRAQAKVEPPLTNLRGAAPLDANNGTATGGQAFVLTCIAEITVHGKTIAGQVVSGVGRVQVDFADWPQT